MAHAVLELFLSQRKEGWLKTRLKASMSDDAKAEMLAQADAKFDPEVWLPMAAASAGSIRFTSHPVTFTHPSAKRSGDDETSAVLHNAQFVPDGYWRSGNAVVDHDAIVNAKDLPVHAFLELRMDDGRSMLEHIVDNTKLCQAVLTIDAMDVDALREGFLQAVPDGLVEAVSSSKLKQVYFPFGQDDYHLLSLVTPSSLVYETRRRMEVAMFSDEVKAIKDLRRSGRYSEQGYREYSGLTVAVYGGDNPQNISAQNTKGNGKTLLLPSMPPSLSARVIRMPKYDFFNEVVSFKDFNEHFTHFHALLLASDKQPRAEFIEKRDAAIHQVMLDIVGYVFQVRAVSETITSEPALPFYQRVWLLSSHEQARQDSDGWLDDVVDGCASWFVREYLRRVPKAVELGSAERSEIATIMRNFVQENEELFL